MCFVTTDTLCMLHAQQQGCLLGLMLHRNVQLWMIWQGVCWLLQALQHHFQNPYFKVFADKVGLAKTSCFSGVWWPPVLCINV